MTEEKSIKFTRTLINDCYSLGLYQVPRDLILSKHKCSSLITSCHSFAKVYMSVDPANDSKIRVRIITDKASLNQAIEIVYKRITFGLRRYFLCRCGRMVNSLYLKNGILKCRHCHQLAYEITRLRKGTFLYRINRISKIKSIEHQTRNLFYGDRGYTRKAKRAMALLAKYS